MVDITITSRTYKSIMRTNIIKNVEKENAETRLIKDEVKAILLGRKGYCFNVRQLDNILYVLHNEKPDKEYIGKLKDNFYYEIVPMINK